MTLLRLHSFTAFPLSVTAYAVLLSISSSHVQAAEITTDHKHVESVNADMEVDNTKPHPHVANTQLSAKSLDMFAQCAKVQTDAARLACYDKVVHTGTAAVAEIKQPLDIAKTLQVSIQSLKPQVVLAGTEDTLSNANHSIATVSLQDDANYDTTLTNTQLLSKEDIQVLANVGVTRDELGRYTPLSLAFDLDKNSELGVWSARPYNPMYVLPAYYTFNPNRHPITPTQAQKDFNSDEQRNLELKAQISVKSKVMEDLFGTNADLWFGYTQQMHWQVYNENNSRPFRATDYEPEIFLTQPVKAELPYDGRLRMLGVGAIHHSNGQSDPLSRSWNRLYLMGGMEWGNISVIPRIWAHVKGSDSNKPSDNPDITDYYGHGDIKVLYDLGQGRAISGTGRYNFIQNNGALQIDYTHPLSNDVHGFVQLFHGYGESIIDYNKSTTAVGLGVSLDGWKGL